MGLKKHQGDLRSKVHFAINKFCDVTFPLQASVSSSGIGDWM